MNKPDGLSLERQIARMQEEFESCKILHGEKSEWAIEAGSILASLLELQDRRNINRPHILSKDCWCKPDCVDPHLDVVTVPVEPERVPYTPEAWAMAEWAIPPHVHPLGNETWDVSNCAGAWKPPTPDQVRGYIAQAVYKFQKENVLPLELKTIDLTRQLAERDRQLAEAQRDGMVMVPKQPTRGMLNAAVDVDAFKLGDISPLGFRCSPQQLFEKCYGAMIDQAIKEQKK